MIPTPTARATQLAAVAALIGMLIAAALMVRALTQDNQPRMPERTSRADSRLRPLPSTPVGRLKVPTPKPVASRPAASVASAPVQSQTSSSSGGSSGAASSAAGGSTGSSSKPGSSSSGGSEQEPIVIGGAIK